MPEHRRVAIALRLDQPHPNHQDVFAGVLRYARDHPHWTCVVDEHPGYARESADQPDGVIARMQPNMQRRLARRRIPLVNTHYSHRTDAVAGVYLDVERCGQIAAEHLIDRGFARLAYLDSGTYRQAWDMGQAFVHTAEERARRCALGQLDSGEYGDPRHWQKMRRQIGRFLDTLTPPVGILASVPWEARLLTSICEQRGWHVPQQVALICIDNQKNIVELAPQITCIDCNYEQVGYEAAALLERIMDGSASPAEQVRVPPRGIITRESTDYFAVDDPTVAEALRYIARHLGEKLTVERIADAVAVSPRTLQRRFDRAMGRAISDEIRRLRLELAKRLLSEKGLAINRIARQCGFNNAVVMGQIFQRELGLSPSAYRKQRI